MRSACRIFESLQSVKGCNAGSPDPIRKQSRDLYTRKESERLKISIATLDRLKASQVSFRQCQANESSKANEKKKQRKLDRLEESL